MATREECEQALVVLGTRLSSGKASLPDRTVSCEIPDLAVTYSGQLRQGALTEITDSAQPRAQVRLIVRSDDLVELVAGTLAFGTAYRDGRLKVQASFRDLLTLRSLA